MVDPHSPSAVIRRHFVLAASLLFMVIGTGSIYFLVVALKLISAEFEWPRVIASTAYSLLYFGAGIGGIFMGYVLDRLGMAIPALVGASMLGRRRDFDIAHIERMAALFDLRRHDGPLRPLRPVLAADRQYHPLVRT